MQSSDKIENTENIEFVRKHICIDWVLSHRFGFLVNWTLQRVYILYMETCFTDFVGAQNFGPMSTNHTTTYLKLFFGDDHQRNPKINEIDHMVGQLTTYTHWHVPLEWICSSRDIATIQIWQFLGYTLISGELFVLLPFSFQFKHNSSSVLLKSSYNVDYTSYTSTDPWELPSCSGRIEKEQRLISSQSSCLSWLNHDGRRTWQ